MNREQAILAFRSAGIGDWKPIGWTNGRQVWATEFDGHGISVHTDTLDGRTGVLIHCPDMDRAWCFAESWETVTDWMEYFMEELQ